MRLSGLVNDEFVLDKDSADWIGPGTSRRGEFHRYEVVVPPGRHAIRFQCDPPPHFTPADNRRFCYFILNFERKEIR
jgi:hypothetical protein